MQGDREASRRLLGKVDARSLPARVSGRVALAQALLEPPGELQQAGLSLAMATMPGTLIEESALRRSALAYAASHDERGVWARLDRYSRRFASSLYASAFWEDVLSELVSWAAKGPGPDPGRLDAVLAPLPMPYRRLLYLQLARKSAAAQLPAFTTFAGRRLERLAVEGSPESQLGHLYGALFEIVSSDGGKAITQLRAISRDLLPHDDRTMLDAALSLARQIDQPLSALPALAGDDGFPKDGLELRAENLLKETQKLLSKGSS